MKTHFIKSSYFISLLSLCSLGVFAQKANVGIGTTQPNESAILDVSSTSKGLLIPRMTLHQRNTIQNPADGLMVYQTDILSGFYFYDGKEWKPVGAQAKSIAGVDGDWTLLGNAAPAGSFIGTTNGTPLEFRFNNVRAGILSNTQTFLGQAAGVSNTTGQDNMGLGVNALMSNTTGSLNVAVGTNALRDNNGNWNSAIGYGSLILNTTGAYNLAIGGNSLSANTTGQSNMALGVNALYSNVTGSRNVGIGVNAIYNSLGNDNIGIGNEAGFNKNGSGNIYIGSFAGRASSSTAEDNKLYISNSATATPLIYGDFSAKFISIGDLDVTKRATGAAAGYKLMVAGAVMSEKLKIALASSADWSDYVFEPSYKLMPLDNVESFVKENKHLPNVPSADEMASNGLDVSQTSKMFMEKIEELTLYMIEMNKEIKLLKAENKALKKSLDKK